jgi:hypothetical protein
MPEKIVKAGRHWLVVTHNGKRILGEHPTEIAAQAQKTAIALSRARRAGDRVPPPPRKRRR